MTYPFNQGIWLYLEVRKQLVVNEKMGTLILRWQGIELPIMWTSKELFPLLESLQKGIQHANTLTLEPSWTSFLKNCKVVTILCLGYIFTTWKNLTCVVPCLKYIFLLSSLTLLLWICQISTSKIPLLFHFSYKNFSVSFKKSLLFLNNLGSTINLYTCTGVNISVQAFRIDYKP